MLSTEPMPFKEALASRDVKSLLPTTGRTRDLQQLGADITRRSMYSAAVTSTELLQKESDLIRGIISGDIDQASARLKIKDLLADMGYQPDPEKAGGLEDLSSTPRIDVVLETNVDVARGAGWYEQGQDPSVLSQFPAQELVRFYEPKGGDSAKRDWAARWMICGGKFYDGRMIALKDDPIWDKLGDPDLFPDGLGNPFPPFAFNSGMDVIDIDREEATAVGLDVPDVAPEPQPLDLNADLQAKPDVRDDNLRTMLEATGLGRFDSDGVFVFNEGGDNG